MYTFLIFVFGIISFFFFNYLFNKLAYKFNLIDFPDERKLHINPTPTTGGIIIYLSCAIPLYLFDVPDFIKILYFVSSLPLIMGAIDDSKNLGIIFRIFSVIFSSSILVGTGLYVTNLGYYDLIGNTYLGTFGIFFTIISVLGLTNSFNFIDGIDGLCASIFIISLLNILFLSYFYGSFLMYEFIIFIILITLIFLMLNITNSKFKIFLGDAGSNFFGFIISWLLIFYSSDQNAEFHQSLVIWCVTIPLYDFFSVVLKRIYYGKNPFKYDRTHIHHSMQNYGFNSLTILISLIVLSISLFFIGLLVNIIFGHIVSILFFVGIFFIYFYIKEFGLNLLFKS